MDRRKVGVETAKLTAEFQAMRSAQVIDGIRQDYRRVGPPLRSCDRPAEAEANAGHRDLRQADGFGNAVGDFEVCRIYFGLMPDRRVDAIEADARYASDSSG